MSHAPIELPVEGLSDGVVRLRPLGEGDLPALVAAIQEPDIARWTRIPQPYGEPEAREWLDQQPGRRRAGAGIDLLIVNEVTGELLGAIGVPRIDWNEGRCELGYWMAREHRRRGFMRRAIRLLAGWIFDALPVERISILAAVENSPSRAVAERAGFVFEGVLRSYLVFKDGRHDVAMYSLLRGEAA